MGKTYTVKWIYCVSVAEGGKSGQARVPVHCSTTWFGGNLGEAQFFSPFCFSAGRRAPVNIPLRVGKENCFSFTHIMKTNKNVKDRSTNQVATSCVDLVSEAPQVEIVNREQPKAIVGVIAAVPFSH